MTAVWRGKVLARSDSCVFVEGTYYFPPDSVDTAYLQQSGSHITTPEKGEAWFYDVVVDGQVNKDAAWFYPEPEEAVQQIKDYVAFWKGILIEE
jgi:uncharacterized protein (DUF427 family)